MTDRELKRLVFPKSVLAQVDEFVGALNATTRKEVTALYRTFNVDTLKRLRMAFELDMQTTDRVTVAFCRGRIAVIDDVLKETDGQKDSLAGGRRARPHHRNRGGPR
jgi:hypothetical protein